MNESYDEIFLSYVLYSFQGMLDKLGLHFTTLIYSPDFPLSYKMPVPTVVPGRRIAGGDIRLGLLPSVLPGK